MNLINIYRNPAFFADKNLEEVIKENMGISGYISIDDVRGISVLDASWRNIRELYGLRNLTNLKELYLYKNIISDIYELRYLTKLECLDIEGNPDIKDVDIVSLSSIIEGCHILPCI